MDPHSTARVVLLLTLLSIHVTDSLLCYQCATTDENHECVDDYGGFMNTSLGLIDKYYKDCTASNVNWTRCMIMTAQGRGGLFELLHRGCHDGRTFTTLNYHHRFENLPPNNESTCARVEESRELVCFRFCDTDFCNGPQPPPPVVDPCIGMNSTNASWDALGCGALGLRGTVSFTWMLMALQFCVGVLMLGIFF